MARLPHRILLPRSTRVEKWPLGVFASIDAGLGREARSGPRAGRADDSIARAAARPRARREQARRFLDRLAELGIRITAVFGGFEGESYADIPTVARTVGLVPPETRAARTAEMKEIADFARLLGVDVVALAPGLRAARRRPIRSIAKCSPSRASFAITAASQRQALHLETGQEPADTLLQFIGDVERDNLFINFDPANMILYGSGEPIEALEKVGRYVRSVHCKDGKWAAHPGKEWGSEVAAGRRRRRHGTLPAHARQDRLPRPADDRARNSARARAAKSRDRPGAEPAARAEGQDRLTTDSNSSRVPLLACQAVCDSDRHC